MVTINKINLKQQDAVQKEFLKNISVVLQKIGSSHKTKAIHALVRKEILYIGYGVTDISKKRNAEYGAMYLSGNKLSGLAADISAIVDKADLSDVARKVKDIEKANKELSRVKTTITDTSALQLKNLDSQIEKYFEDLLDSIDYFALVDVYYYLYIEALSIIGLKGNGKNKIYESAYNVFKEIIKRILTKAHVDVTGDDKERFEICLDYTFARAFSDQTSNTTLAKLSRLYSPDKIEFLRELKPDQYDEFKNIATILTKAGIVNMTESAFMAGFHSIVGSGSVQALSGTFDEMVAYIISTNYKSTIFDAPHVAEKDQDRLEQLILNFKKDIILKA